MLSSLGLLYAYMPPPVVALRMGEKMDISLKKPLIKRFAGIVADGDRALCLCVFVFRKVCIFSTQCTIRSYQNGQILTGTDLECNDLCHQSKLGVLFSSLSFKSKQVGWVLLTSRPNVTTFYLYLTFTRRSVDTNFILIRKYPRTPFLRDAMILDVADGCRIGSWWNGFPDCFYSSML